MSRRVLITGLNGQDGGYLAELAVARGDEVIGTVRRPADALREAGLEHLEGRVTLLAAELGEPETLATAVREAEPDEVYHLASPTFVPDTWRDPTGTMRAVAEATSALLGAVLERPETRALVPSSSTVYGEAGESPQSERTPMRPRTPYGAAKVAAHHLVGTMRDHHGRFLVSAVCFNHESPRRPERFLPRKVSAGVAAIAAGRRETLTLGALDAIRDWCHARDVVQGFALALAADEPSDYVFASGEGRTVDELVTAAFDVAGVDREGRIEVDQRFVRAPEAWAQVGDITTARERLGWAPRVSFEALVTEMVRADLEREGVAATPGSRAGA